MSYQPIWMPLSLCIWSQQSISGTGGQEVELVHWQDAVRKAILVQPSSAASERVFSLLAVCFNDEQRSALAETVEASVMLRFNRRK